MINEEVELPIFSKFGETKNKSVICFWKLPFGLLENRKKKKKNLSFGFHFLRKSCAMKEERRRFTFSIIIPRKFQKKKKKTPTSFFLVVVVVVVHVLFLKRDQKLFAIT